MSSRESWKAAQTADLWRQGFMRSGLKAADREMKAAARLPPKASGLLERLLRQLHAALVAEEALRRRIWVSDDGDPRVPELEVQHAAATRERERIEALVVDKSSTVDRPQVQRGQRLLGQWRVPEGGW